MKIALLAPSYLYDKTAIINGTFVQLHNLATAFSKSGLEVHYICSTKDIEKPEYELENDIHFHWIQKKSGFLEWKRLMTIYNKKLHDVKPNAIYTRGRNVLQYLAGKYAKEQNIPYVWGTNGEDSAEFWKNVKRLNNKKKSFFRKLLLLPLKAYEDVYINKGMKLSNHIVNQSANQQRTTKKNLNKEGVILPSYFLPIKPSEVKENQILWLANLSKGKQPEIFIELIKNIDLKNWQAILAGGTLDGTYKEEIEQRASSVNIIMHGKIDFEDSFSYYKNARIYVNTSKPNADGLPNAYIQSWLSGTVVFSLHHDPNSWMKDYNIGFCAHGDLAKLVKSIQEIINDPKRLEVMSKNAKKFAEKQFSSSSIIEKYILLFKNRDNEFR